MAEKERTETSLAKVSESAAITLSPETVTRYINALATPQEIALFLNQCAMFGLNPFKREIYLIKYSQKDPATFVVGYEVYLKRADRTKNWAGMNSGTRDDKDGNLLVAWVDVYRKDWGERPLHHEVALEEYVQTKDEWVNGQKTGRKVPTRFWADKPRTMLKKVAIAQALRMAFPDEFAGMPYTSEEMPVEHSKLPTAEIDPKADPFSKENYETLKATPVKDIKDEFNPGIEPTESAHGRAEAEADLAPEEKWPTKVEEGPTMAQLEKFAKAKVELDGYGINEETLWKGIHRFSATSLKRVVTEASEYTPAEMELVLGYMNRWRKAMAEEKIAKEKAAKAEKK